MIWSVPAFLAFCPAFYLWYPTLHPTELSSFSLPQNAVSCLTCAVPSAQNSLPSPPLSGLVFKSHVTSFRKPSLTFPSEPEPSLLGSWTTQGHHSCGLFAPHSNWGLFICLSWVHWSQGQCLNLPPPRLWYLYLQRKLGQYTAVHLGLAWILQMTDSLLPQKATCSIFTLFGSSFSQQAELCLPVISTHASLLCAQEPNLLLKGTDLLELDLGWGCNCNWRLFLKQFTAACLG